LKSRGLAHRNGNRVPFAVLNLDFNDLATIVNGQPDDEVTNRPFDCHFTRDNILNSSIHVYCTSISRRMHFMLLALSGGQ
jgi:hypothetical protein